MATNRFFNNVKRVSEQDLMTDLVAESIQIHGVDLIYIKRENLEIDPILGEPTMSTFKDVYNIEMYIPNSDIADGQQFFMSKFGINFNETMEAIVSIKRWNETVGDNLIRPREGDLLYVGDPENLKGSFINRMYQIKNVTLGHPERGQFGVNHSYRLTMEDFGSSYEKFETNIDDIDSTFNVDVQEEFINTINDVAKTETQTLISPKGNPFGEIF